MYSRILNPLIKTQKDQNTNGFNINIHLFFVVVYADEQYKDVFFLLKTWQMNVIHR